MSKIFSPTSDGGVSDGEFYGVTVCIPKHRLYESVKKLRSVRPSRTTRLPPLPLACPGHASSPASDVCLQARKLGRCASF